MYNRSFTVYPDVSFGELKETVVYASSAYAISTVVLPQVPPSLFNVLVGVFQVMLPLNAVPVIDAAVIPPEPSIFVTSTMASLAGVKPPS